MLWRTNRREGHTITELVVVIAIIVILSTAAIISFSGLNESVAIRNASRELVTNIRRAQNMALVVAQPPTGVPPPRFGIRIATSPGTSYYLCADANNSGTCETGEKIGSDITFSRGIVIQSVNPSPLNLMFVAPEAYAQFNDAAGAAQTVASVTITLKSPTKNLTKSVVVNVSGRVTIQ